MPPSFYLRINAVVLLVILFFVAGEKMITSRPVQYMR